MSAGFDGVREFPQGTGTAADADFVRRHTGSAIGGVPPFGHPQPIDTVIDEDLLAYDVVWAAAGTPTRVFPLAPGRLLEATGGRAERVAPS